MMFSIFIERMKTLGKTITTIACFLLMMSPSLAGFGVSPTNIYNEYLKPGAHFEKVVTLSRSDPFEDLDIVIEPSLGEINSWFRFDPGLTFVFPKGESRKTFKIIVDVPQSASYRGYEGVIRVKALARGQAVQGVSIVKGARLDVDLVTTEVSISELQIKSLKMLDANEGDPLKLEILAENLGNVAVSPDAKVAIKNLQMEDLEEHVDNDLEFVQPNESKTLYAEFKSSLPQGEYFVDAFVLVDGSVVRKERLVFRINAPGEKSADTSGGLSTAFANGISLLRDNASMIGVCLLFAIVAYFLMSKLWKQESMEDKKNELWAPLLGVRASSRIIVSILIGILSAGIFWWFSSHPIQFEKESKKSDISVQPSGGIPLEVVVSEGTDVKGVKEKIDKSDPLVVSDRDKDGKAKYPIYESPDLNSNIVYYALEDEKLDVVEENADWYKVEVGDGDMGWLEKSKVKSSVSQEIQ